MDETQRRKISAKEFLIKNRNLGFGIVGIFISLFILYFAFIYFYSHSQKLTADTTGTETDNNSPSFFGSLLPVFEAKEQTNSELDTQFLSNFSGTNNSNGVNGDGSSDNSKIIKIEEKPILGYTVFDKAISIKQSIKNKPKICAQKLETVTKKEERSASVLVFQDMLKSTDGYEDTPGTGILDEATREKIYVFQSRYADILYKKKADKTPTRVIDKETAHFLNLLCNFETENPDDYVQVPTLRYITKENREIFDFNTDSKEKISIAAKLATGTEEIVFSKKGDYVVFRKDVKGTIDSVLYNIKNKSITHLENNITTLDFNDNNILIYGIPGFNGMTIKSYDPLKNVSSRIAILPLNEWNIYTISASEIGINSKPSAYAEGIYMILNTNTKKLRQLAGPLLGLSLQKTNLADFTILSTGGKGTVRTLLLNNKTRNVGDFGIKTFAEKCSQTIFADGIFCAVPKNLSENFIYPDDWYKGKLVTEDILVFKTINGTSTKVISYLENRPISITNLNVNKNGIFFMDENTFSLYSLEL